MTADWRPPTTDWDALAPLYDEEHDAFQDDIPLYAGFASRFGGPILEAGCGTGRLLPPLMGAGRRVTGLDVSRGMLRRAQARLSRPPGARLVQGDLRRPPLRGSYALILLALDAFRLLPTPEAQGEALGALSALLAPGGGLLIDVENPAPVPPADGTLVLDWWRPLDGGASLAKLASRRYDPSTQVEEVTLFYDRVETDGALRRQAFQIRLRSVSAAELRLMLAGAGLELEQLYGDYDLGPYRADSPRLIALARRPG